MAMARRGGGGVVVVVPAFAGGQQADDRIVAAAVGRLVIPIAPDMGYGIDRPGGVPDQHRAQRPGPDEEAGAELERLAGAGTRQQVADEAQDEEGHPGEEGDLHPVLPPLDHGVERIAHEVFRIALRHDARPHIGRAHQQPAEMGPEEALERRMGIALLIGEAMVTAVDGHPEGRRELQAAGSEEGEAVLEPERAGEAAMGEQAVKSEIDPEDAEDIHARGQESDAGPAEEPGKQRQEGEGMTEDEADEGIGLQFHLHLRRDLGSIAIGRRNRICRSDRQFFEPGRDSGIQIQLRQAILKLARAKS